MVSLEVGVKCGKGNVAVARAFVQDSTFVAGHHPLDQAAVPGRDGRIHQQECGPRRPTIPAPPDTEVITSAGAPGVGEEHIGTNAGEAAFAHRA